MAAGRSRTAIAVLVLGALAACGKKGPPLPPLHIVPDAVADVTLRRVGDEVQLRFVLPVKNVNGPNPVNLDHVEIYAATVAAGAAPPPNRDFLHAKYRVGTVAVRPPEPEAAAVPATPPAKPDDRPGPGEVARFTETLDETKLKPVFTTPLVPPAAAPATPSAAVPSTSAVAPAAAGAPATTGAAASPSPAVPSSPVRIYAIRGIARNGRAGQPSPRLTLPLVDTLPPPSNVQVNFTASAVAVTWLPPVAEATTAAPPAFNIYGADPTVPLNNTPLTSPAFERPGVEFGKEECFVIRSVVRTGPISLESDATAPACVTPVDLFPPSAPPNLSAVSSDGGVNLIWEASPDPDVAGYIVLRAEAPGDTLSAITATPVQGTTYRDTAVTLGVRYVYAIVAVDKATPPNPSAQSRRVEETVR